jgi:acetylornithine deacetylase
VDPSPYLLDVTRRLVAMDTVSLRSNAEALALLGDELERWGFEVAFHEDPGAGQGNLVAWAGPPEPGGLILSGHVDVVPFADQPGWTRDPLRLAVDGGRVYGRGTTDMKGFLAQVLDAVRRLDGASLASPLLVVVTGDEEIGCRGAARLVPDLAGLLGGRPLPRLAWIGEPTSWRVFHAHKGIVEFGVRVRGRGGHSSLPEAGVNAIAAAARALLAVGELQAELRGEAPGASAKLFPEAPYTTLNFGTIRGGSASNMIAEECCFRVSYRPLPDSDPLAVHREVARRLAALELRDFGASALRAHVEVEEARVVPGLLSARDTALERCLLETLGETCSGGAPFCTDGGQLARLGIASLICGPGELGEAHAPDESVGLASLAEGPDRILAVVRRLCGGRVRS